MSNMPKCSANLEKVVTTLNTLNLRGEHITELKRTPFWLFIECLLNDNLTYNWEKQCINMRHSISYLQNPSLNFVFERYRTQIEETDVRLIFGIRDGGRQLRPERNHFKITAFLHRCFPEKVEIIKTHARADFKLTKGLIRERLVEASQKHTNTDAQDVARLITVYILVMLLIPARYTSLSWTLTTIVDDFESICEYNWSSLIVDTLVARLKESKSLAQSACVLMLPYWLCEHTTITEPVQPEFFPRFMKWDLVQFKKMLILKDPSELKDKLSAKEPLKVSEQEKGLLGNIKDSSRCLMLEGSQQHNESETNSAIKTGGVSTVPSKGKRVRDVSSLYPAKKICTQSSAESSKALIVVNDDNINLEPSLPFSRNEEITPSKHVSSSKNVPVRNLVPALKKNEATVQVADESLNGSTSSQHPVLRKIMQRGFVPKGELEKSQAQAEGLIVELESTKFLVQNLQKKLERTEASEKDLQKKLSEACCLLQSADVSYENLCTEFVTVKQKLERSEASEKELKEKLSEACCLLESADLCQENFDKLYTELAYVKEELVHSEAKRVEAENKTLNSEKASKGKLSEVEKKSEKLSNELASVKKELERSEEKRVEAENQSLRAKSSENASKEKLSEVGKKTEKLSTELASARKELERSEDKRVEAENQSLRAKNSENASKEKLSEVEKKSEELSTELASVKKELERSEEKRVEAKNQSLRAKNSENASKEVLSEVGKKSEKLSTELASVKELERSEAKRVEAEDQSLHAKNSENASKEKLSEVEKESQKLSSELAFMKTQNEVMEQKLIRNEEERVISYKKINSKVQETMEGMMASIANIQKEGAQFLSDK